LAEDQPVSISDVAGRLAQNVRQLRTLRALTQLQMAKLSGLPRATWANLESGAANPTLTVLQRVALALQVSIEELIAQPKASARHYARSTLQTRRRGAVELRSLLPDPIPGMLIDRMELPAGASMTGVPHTPGTREYLTCEQGTIQLTASGERWLVGAGELVVFRGDQRHAYQNPGTATAVGYSVVILAPAAG
jgi:XRE family transcriptional regulator, regulator of sulfur utilization